MNSQELLAKFGEFLAAVDARIDEQLNASQLQQVDRAWRWLYLDELTHAPCEHPDRRRIGDKYCTACGKNIGPAPEEEKNP